MAEGRPLSLLAIAADACINLRIKPKLSNPEQVFILFEHACLSKQYDYIYMLFHNFETFALLLDEKNRTNLLGSFSNVHNTKPWVAELLLQRYKKSIEVKNDIMLGLKFGEFFIELGSFKYAIKFLKVALDNCKISENLMEVQILADCFSNLVYAQAYAYKFKDAFNTFQYAKNILKEFLNRDKFHDGTESLNFANFYNSIAFLYLGFGEYFQALQYTFLALEKLNDQLPDKVIIKVIRISAKVYLLNRRLAQATLLIRHAVDLATAYKYSNPNVYAASLVDFGFFCTELKDFTAACGSIMTAANAYRKMFGRRNLYVALAQRDYARALLGQMSESDDFQIRRYLRGASTNLPEECIEDNPLILNSIRDINAKYSKKKAINPRLYNISRPRMLLKTVKNWFMESLGEFKKYIDYPRDGRSIETVRRLLLLGQLSGLLKQFGEAVEYYNEAEEIFNSLTYRSNAEHCLVTLERTRLFISSTSSKNEIEEAIRTINLLIRRLMTFEGPNSETLGILYKEIVRLYRLRWFNSGIGRYDYTSTRVAWKVWCDNARSFWDSVCDRINPTNKTLNTIIDTIQNMDMTCIDTHGYAAQIRKNDFV